MTTFVNVTDAIGIAGNHGITRVERKLAGALWAHDDVRFVVMHRGRLWNIENSTVAERLERPPVDRQPRLERFGIDSPPTRMARSRRLIESISPGAPKQRSIPLGSAPLEAFEGGRGDALVSVGVDWQHGLLDAVERLVLGSGASYVGFCYDLIPIDHPEWIFPPDPARFVRHFSRMARIASTILCISESTRADFSRHFSAYASDRLKRLTLGADAAIDVGPSEAAFADSIFDGEPYAVYCATLDRRKNHQILYRAMREMARRRVDGNLVFVGMPGSGVADLLGSMRNDPLVRGRIAHVTNCDDRHLAALYQRATFAVYPSLYEGWGLGVTEAMAHGKRCIVATGSSLGEASFGTAREVHPLATAEWVEAMSELFEHPGHLDGVRLPTWNDAAEQLMRLVAR